MDVATMVSMLEDAVYSHTKYVDRCKILVRRLPNATGSGSLKLEESFSLLAKASRKLEEVLSILSNFIVQNSTLPEEDLEAITAVVFYVYEVAIEEERNLWNKYQMFTPNENVDEHYVRLDKMKILAQKVLEIAEKTVNV